MNFTLQNALDRGKRKKGKEKHTNIIAVYEQTQIFQ